MGRRLGLLVCGHVHPDAQHIGGDYPELFSSVFAPLGFEVVPYAAEERVLPDSVDECDAWITSPSRCSVLDELPWIDDMAAFLNEAVERERPLLGICFGHQLLAHVRGGTVARAESGWGVGVKTYEVVERRPWMDPPLDQVHLIASHEDQVIELPAGANLLMMADYCPNAMYELGERCVAMQPHVEFSSELSAELVSIRAHMMPEETTAAARASYATPLDRTTVARWFSNFIG